MSKYCRPGGRKTGKSKKKADQIHASRRAIERFGMCFSKRMRDEAVERIQNNQATFVRKDSNTRTVWDNAIPRYPQARVLYSRVTKEIVTMWNKNG